MQQAHMPPVVTPDLAELVGVLIGDGYLYGNKGQYIIGIVGDPKKDFLYFCYLQKLFLSLFNLKPRITKKGRGLRLLINNKDLFLFLTKELYFPQGKGKGQIISISPLFLSEFLLPALLRGLFDADGTIFTSRKKGSPSYPCIELTTTSKKLAYQVESSLHLLGFRVPPFRTFKYKNPNYYTSYKISLYGQNNARLWFEKIGFSLPRKQEKLKEIIMYGNTGI